MKDYSQTTIAGKEELVRKAFFIRRFEEKLLELFSKGELQGTIHTCIGQEWTALAAAEALERDDSIFSNHRGHGHYIAWTDDAYGLLAEIMGKADGVCGGLGGSQHLHNRNFYSNGIQGGMVPVGAGKALAEKLRDSGNISLVFIGDGTLGQGVVYESLNIASKWGLPLLVVIENNGIAQSTHIEQTMAGSIEKRAAAFGIKYLCTSTWEWEEMFEDFRYAARYVRENSAPFILEVRTFRLKAHSKGDDTRDSSIISHYERKDPLNTIAASDRPSCSRMIRGIDRELGRMVKKAAGAVYTSIEMKTDDTGKPSSWRSIRFERDRIVNLIHGALRKRMSEDDRVILIGEDIEAPYGGAFKVTRDLSRDFPGRVRNTPISEGSIVGLGTGLALGGYRPVVEIMFGDFMSLCFDQLLNHACKFPYMYGKGVDVPLIVRTPMGGNRGYGPTHSQSLEKHFMGIPNLDILALNARVSPEYVYERLFDTIRIPTLVVENKVLYTRFLEVDPPLGYKLEFSNDLFPVVRLSPIDQEPAVTVFCYGGVLGEVEKALEAAFDEYDIVCEVIAPLKIQPLDVRPVLDSVRRTRRLLTVEEGPSVAALGAEVGAKLMEAGVTMEGFKRIGCNSFIPCSRELEKQVLPGVDDVVKALKEVVDAAV
jgi:2-oxoisovalerate dehydrogenase E1 component